MTGERIALELLRSVGYANFFALTLLIFTLKGSTWESWLLFALPPSISHST